MRFSGALCSWEGLKSEVMLKEDDEGQGEGSSERTSGTSAGWIRRALIAAGFLFVGLGILGIFLPVLPTTPFLLLAAACFARSSQKFYNWLLNNRWFGRYIRNYREGKGIPLRVKIITILLLWVTILISAYFVSIIYVRIILILVAIGVTIHVARIGRVKL